MNSTLPDISVIMPVFNGEKYLKEAIDSILSQSYEKFEFIIVNDGSTDSSEYIILSYQDERIRYIKQQNAGVGPALALGCSLAKGKYIARMDADDISYPERLAIQVAYLEENMDTVLVSSAVRYINSRGDEIGRSFPYTSNTALKRKLKTMNPICHPGVMIKTTAYKESIGYINIQPFEDWVLWSSICKFGEIHNFRFPLLKYRILDDSVSRKITINQTLKLFDYINENVKKGYLTDTEVKEYNHRYKEEKLKLKLSLRKDEIANSKRPMHSITQSQHIYYYFLKKMRVPESFIEFSICSFKNTFLFIR